MIAGFDTRGGNIKESACFKGDNTQMICDFESKANITETVLGNSCDESCNENNGQTESSSGVIEDNNSGAVDERRDNRIVKDNKEDGTIKDSKIKNNELNIDSSCNNNKNNNNLRKKETKYENKNNAHKSRNNNTEDNADDDADNRAFVAFEDYDGQTVRKNNNIISLAAEKEISDQVNMGQAAPNCKKNGTDGENVHAARIRKSNEQENKDRNPRGNCGEENVKRSLVGKSCTDNEETQRYDDCVIVVDRQPSQGEVKKESDNVNCKEDTGKISEESKDDKRCEVCVDVEIIHNKDNLTNIIKQRENIECTSHVDSTAENIECTSHVESTTAGNTEPHIDSGPVAPDVDSNDSKLDTRKQQEGINKKSVAENIEPHIDGGLVAPDVDSNDSKLDTRKQQEGTNKKYVAENTEPHIDGGPVAPDVDSSDSKLDTRKQQESIKKKYVAESHMKEGDAVDRSWDSAGLADVNISGGNQQDMTTDSKETLGETATRGSIDNRNSVSGKDTNHETQGTPDVATNADNNNERQRTIEPDAQDASTDEKSNDNPQITNAGQDCTGGDQECKTKIDPKDTHDDDNVGARCDEAVKDDDNVPVDDNPLSDSGICYYKSKSLLKNQETMNHREKVKVDESEPSWNEEAPFERRDVLVKKDRWVTDLYAVDSLLGRGKFGEVKKCRERRTGRQLAAKFIEVSGPQDRTDVINEVEIMKHLQHPRLLQLYDAFENRDKFCLVLELVSGGELFERVINDDFILTEKACVMFMRQICDGVAFMHSENILHLDMKPENILCLTREGNRIKIIDFGLARKFSPKDDLRVLFGTPEFVAPEVANFDPICPATDMWSVGVICYVLLSGLSPFMGETEAETLSNVTMARWDFNAEEFENISVEAKDFIAKLLVKDPRKRISAAQCLDHQWLRRSTKRESRLPERSLSKKRLRKFVYRRKWQKAINAMLALRRMGVSLC